MAQNNPNIKRFSIDYFEGVNTLVGLNIAKKQELAHAENVRATMIGTLDKRGGTIILGNALTNVGNYGLFFFQTQDRTINSSIACRNRPLRLVLRYTI